MNKGTHVRAVIVDHEQRGYTEQARHERILYNEMVGVVTDRSDSHGLCYEVTFHNGATAWFNPDELEESV